MRNILAIISLFFCLGLNGQQKDTMRVPAFLNPGDTVAIIAPGYSLKEVSLARAINVLRFWGLEPVLGAEMSSGNDLFVPKTNTSMGRKEGRLKDLRWALESESVKAIICARGGYGCIELLDSLTVDSFTKHPKWLVGYSDITTLHAASVSAGVMSIHGNMCGEIGDPDGPNESCDKLRSLLFGAAPAYYLPGNPLNTEGQAEGILVGGNMAILETLPGTPYDFTNKDGIILFIEEVGEPFHKLDRFFNTLKIQGKMDKIKGIIVGEFTRCSQDMPYDTAEEMLSRHTAGLGIPVCYGFPAGHGDVNMPLIEGARVGLDVSSERTMVIFNLQNQY